MNKLKYYKIAKAVALIAIFVTGACAMLSTDILEFAKSLHAFSQGSITSEVYGSLWVLYNATSVGSITCEKLDNVFTSIKLMQQIKADKFLYLKGKDIGLALDKARMEAADIFVQS